MRTLHHEDATPEDMPKLLALLVSEVQGLREDLRREREVQADARRIQFRTLVRR